MIHSSIFASLKPLERAVVFCPLYLIIGVAVIPYHEISILHGVGEASFSRGDPFRSENAWWGGIEG